MGRTKVQLKLIPDTSRRRATYRKRISNLKKKAFELSTLCDIGVALVSVGPDSQVHTWPENEHMFIGIVKKFIGLNKEEQTKRQVTLSDYLDGRVRKLKANLARLQSPASESTVEARDKGLTHQSPVSIACDAFDNNECSGSFDELLPTGEDCSFSQYAIRQSKDYSDPLSPASIACKRDTSPVELLTIGEDCIFSQDVIWPSSDYSGDQDLDSISASLFVTTDDNLSSCIPMSSDPIEFDGLIDFDGFGDAVTDTVFNTIGEDYIFSQDAICPSMDSAGDQGLDPNSAPLFSTTNDNLSSCIPTSLDPIGFDGFSDAVPDTVFNTIGEDYIFSQDALWPSMDYSGNQVLDPTSAPLFVPTDNKQAVDPSSSISMSLDPTVGFDGFRDAVSDTVFDTMFSSPSLWII